MYATLLFGNTVVILVVGLFSIGVIAVARRILLG